MKPLILSILLFLAVSVKATNTLVNIGGWNAYVHLPASYNASTTNLYPAIIFFPGLGEIGTDPSKLLINGPSARIANTGWNGNVTVDGSTIEFIVISLQPPTQYPMPWEVMNRINLCMQNYRIDPNFVNYTGLSHGGWISCITATYKPTITDYSYLDLANTVVEIEGVMPLDTYDQTAPGYQRFTDWANRGGKFLGFAQTGVGSIGYWAVNIPMAMGQNASYIIAGTGGHCCWGIQYGQNGPPEKYMIAGQLQDMYEWIARRSTYTIVPIGEDPAGPPRYRTPFLRYDANTIYLKATRGDNYTLYTVQGQILQTGKYSVYEIKIDISKYTSGLYILKTGQGNLKIIKH